MSKKFLKTILFLSLVFSIVSVGFFVSEPANAKTLSYTPKSIRGTFYRYSGKGRFSTITIGAKSASIKHVGSKAFRISSKSKGIRQLKFNGFQKGPAGVKLFTLQKNLKYSYQTAFPEHGMGLTHRKIKGKYYRVIRGYQGGYWFDYISRKVRHDYLGLANGTH